MIIFPFLYSEQTPTRMEATTIPMIMAAPTTTMEMEAAPTLAESRGEKKILLTR